MLTHVAPQKVCDPQLGYEVQVRDRSHVEYLAGDKTAAVEVDFGPVVGVYARSLTQWETTAGDVQMSSSEQDTVLTRIIQALEFMGCQTETC